MSPTQSHHRQCKSLTQPLSQDVAGELSRSGLSSRALFSADTASVISASITARTATSIIRAQETTIRRQQPFQFNARDLTSTLGHGVRPLHRVGDVEHHHHAVAGSQYIAFAQQARKHPDGATLALQGWRAATVRRPYWSRTMGW
jgi:hypothetical protein